MIHQSHDCNVEWWTSVIRKKASRTSRQAALQTSWTPMNQRHSHHLNHYSVLFMIVRSDVWSIMMSFVSRLSLVRFLKPLALPKSTRLAPPLFWNCKFACTCHYCHCDHHHGGVLKVRHEFGFSSDGWAPMPVICLMTADLLAFCWLEYTTM